MVRINPLGDCLSRIAQAEKSGKREVLVSPSSALIIRFLQVMLKDGYISEFECIDDGKDGKIVIQLNGRINKCAVISPRFDTTVKELEKWVTNLLPSRQFGKLIITTTEGVMSHEDARKKKLGGQVLGYYY